MLVRTSDQTEIRTASVRVWNQTHYCRARLRLSLLHNCVVRTTSLHGVAFPSSGNKQVGTIDSIISHVLPSFVSVSFCLSPSYPVSPLSLSFLLYVLFLALALSHSLSLSCPSRRICLPCFEAMPLRCCVASSILTLGYVTDCRLGVLGRGSGKRNCARVCL